MTVNHLTHPADEWGPPRDRAAMIRHLSTHPEHAWRYPPGYDFGDPAGDGSTGLAWAETHRRHHEATPLMTEAEAREVRNGHDALVRDLNRQRLWALKDAYRAALTSRGWTLYGGPSGRDELIGAIVELSYPAARLNESIHVLHHRDGLGSSACEWCHPHAGTGCDCALGRTP